MDNKENKRNLFRAFIFFAFLAGIWLYQEIVYTRSIKTVTSLDYQYITGFKIYRRFKGPVGEPKFFQRPDPIIFSFLQSLHDLRSYSPSHDTASQEQTWFLEIITESQTIGISCYIPSDKGNIVVGELVSFGEKGRVFEHGHFQSRALFQWYQMYKTQWLEEKNS